MTNKPTLRNSLIYFLSIAFTVVLAYSCGGDSDPVPKIENPSGTPTIGSSGGTVLSKDGLVKVIIPVGALEVNEQIIVEQTSTTEVNTDVDATPLGNIYKLSPSGLKFKTPVEIEINHSGVASNLDPEKTLIGHWSSSSDFEYLNFNKSGSNAIKFKINGFSYVKLYGFDEEVTIIPNKNFEQALIDFKIDTDNAINHRVLTADIRSVTKLDISYANGNDELTGIGLINNVSGIEKFANLEEFTAVKQSFLTLDLSNMLSLKRISMYDVPMRSIDLSGSKNIESILIWACKLQQIDVSQLKVLKALNIWSNELTEVDLSNNPEIGGLNVRWNNISKLDVSNLEKLKGLDFVGNNISEINLESNINLTSLSASDNILTELDLSNNPKLNGLACDNNNLDHINLKNGSNESFLNTNNIPPLTVIGNKSYLCIEVDNAESAEKGLPPYGGWKKDDTARYSENCN